MLRTTIISSGHETDPLSLISIKRAEGYEDNLRRWAYIMLFNHWISESNRMDSIVQHYQSNIDALFMIVFTTRREASSGDFVVFSKMWAENRVVGLFVPNLGRRVNGPRAVSRDE